MARLKVVVMRQDVPEDRLRRAGGVADGQEMRYQTLAEVSPVVGMVNEPLRCRSSAG